MNNNDQNTNLNINNQVNTQNINVQQQSIQPQSVQPQSVQPQNIQENTVAVKKDNKKLIISAIIIAILLVIIVVIIVIGKTKTTTKEETIDETTTEETISYSTKISTQNTWIALYDSGYIVACAYNYDGTGLYENNNNYSCETGTDCCTGDINTEYSYGEGISLGGGLPNTNEE